jgi:hypothetical protein
MEIVEAERVSRHELVVTIKDDDGTEFTGILEEVDNE